MDNQYNVHVLSERRLLKDIRNIDSWMDIHCNAGAKSTNWVGDFPGVGCVWYNPNRIANISSLSKMANKFRINYDIWGSNAFEVNKSASAIWSFVEYPLGLFYIYINNYHVEADLVTTVADKNIITLLRTILVLNMPDTSKIRLVDLAWINS